MGLQQPADWNKGDSVLIRVMGVYKWEIFQGAHALDAQIDTLVAMASVLDI